MSVGGFIIPGAKIFQVFGSGSPLLITVVMVWIAGVCYSCTILAQNGSRHYLIEEIGAVHPRKHR